LIKGGSNIFSGILKKMAFVIPAKIKKNPYHDGAYKQRPANRKDIQSLHKAFYPNGKTILLFHSNPPEFTGYPGQTFKKAREGYAKCYKQKTATNGKP